VLALVFGVVAGYGVFAVFTLNFEIASGRPGHSAALVGLAVTVGVMFFVLIARRALIEMARGIHHWAETVPTGRWLLSCILVGVASRGVWNLLFPPVQRSDPAAFLALARGLIERHQYEIANTHAFWPPGLPFTLVPTLMVAGRHPWGPLCNNMVWYVLTVTVVYWLGRALLEPPGGKIAVLLIALWPNLAFLSGLAVKELVVAALLPSVVLLYLAPWRSAPDDRRVAWSLVAGLVLGYAILTQPSLLLFPAVFFLYEGLRPGARSLRLLRCLALLAGMLLVVAPWTLRNYRVLHAFVLVNTAGGGVLYNANNPTADGRYSSAAVTAFGGLDEVTADRMGRQQAIAWIRGHPRHFVLLAIRKQLLLLGDDSFGAYSTLKRGLEIDDLRYTGFKGVSNLYWLGILVLLALAVVRHWRTSILDRPEFSLLMLGLLYFVVLHSVFESDGRHHVALSGSLAIIAALNVCRRSDTIALAASETHPPDSVSGKRRRPRSDADDGDPMIG